MAKALQLSNGYSALLTQVKRALIEGQQRIEQERVKTYWQTGKVIHGHILKHSDRAEYGAQVIEALAKDLNVEKSVLQRCRKFAQTYHRLPIVARGQQFTWSHYRNLITVSDDKKRLILEKQAAAKGWSAEELAAHIPKKYEAFCQLWFWAGTHGEYDVLVNKE